MDLVQRAEHTGVSWITVHGRTTKQRAEPVNMEAIKLVSDVLQYKAVTYHQLTCKDECFFPCSPLPSDPLVLPIAKNAVMLLLMM